MLIALLALLGVGLIVVVVFASFMLGPPTPMAEATARCLRWGGQDDERTVNGLGPIVRLARRRPSRGVPRYGMTSMLQRGRSVDDVLDELAARQAREPDPHGARLFGLVYPTHRAELERLAEEVTRRYLFGNALNPFRYPELAQLEREVVAMTSALVHRDSATGGGTMTSGGTESILMSMLVNRERARARGVERPQILAARTAHPAYAKAAHYFDMEVVRMPVDDRWRADPEAAAGLITDRTAVIVASAFTYPHGVMDPVTELAAIAAAHGVGCHVDACIGAFVLPFLERLGHDVSPWDFRVAGVTEVSADVHKYGYCPKGASVVLHRDDDWFAHQVFLFEDWPAGLYGSPGVAGARPAAPVAAAWAVMTHLGIDGYLELTRTLVDTTATVRAAVADLANVEVVGDPVGPVLALESSTIDLYAVADVLDDRGWYVNRNAEPHGLHLMLSPAHADVVDQLIADLQDAVGHHGPSRGVGARYS